jgi:hypothetical protein
LLSLLIPSKANKKPHSSEEMGSEFISKSYAPLLASFGERKRVNGALMDRNFGGNQILVGIVINLRSRVNRRFKGLLLNPEA